MSIRTSQVLFGVAGARCIWSRPAAESSAKHGWGCGSNQPDAGPERSSGGIGPRWWWEKEGRKGGREGWMEGGRVGKEKHPHCSPFPLLSLSPFLPKPVTWLLFWDEKVTTKSWNHVSCFSNRLFASHISHWTTAWKSVQAWDISQDVSAPLDNTQTTSGPFWTYRRKPFHLFHDLLNHGSTV